MSWHKMTLKVIDVLALLGHRCLGTYQLAVSIEKGVEMRNFRELNQQVNEAKRMLNSFIQKLTAQVEILQTSAFNLQPE